MKTPEAIKKALACPVDRRGSLLPCSDCEYHGRGLPPCRISVHEDALAYIRQLEAERNELMVFVRGCTACKHAALPEDEPLCCDCDIRNGFKHFKWIGAAPKEGDP